MLELLSRTYGAAYAGCLVKITDTVVGVPLRLYNSALGGLLSDSGQVRLNSVGRLSVYVNSASGVYITLYDRQGTPVTTDRTEAASTELENTTDGVAGSATAAQQDALTAGGGGGVVVVDSSGIMYGPDGNVVAAGGGGSTPLVGNLTSTSTTSALRADQGPAITTLINGKYTKPPTGIPATDLSAAVQTAVTAAGTAVQPSNLKTVNGNSLVGVGNVTITSPTLVGANGTVAGTAGLVPAPAATDNTKYLRGDGTWQTVVSGGGAAATNLTATASPTGVTVESDTGTDAALPLSNGTNAGLMAPAQHTKLAGIATGATANSTDAQLRDRTTHTGTQLASTISDFNATAAAAAPVQSVAGKTGVVTLAAADIGDSSLAGRTLLTAADVPAQLSTLGLTNALKTSDIGVTVAGLVGGKINASALPDIAVTDYLGTAADQAAMLAFTAQKGDWCTRTDTGTNWILTGNSAAVLGDWTQLSYPGAPVTSVAGKTGAVTLAKADVGLANVDNTADANKPVSTAQAMAIDAKYTKPGTGIPATDLTAAAQTSLGKADTALQPGTNLTQTAVTNTTAAGTALLTATDAAAQRTAMGAQQTLTSGVNIKTVNGLSVLGSGNIQTNQVSYGSVGDTAVVVSLSDLNLVGVPHDLTVVPDTGCAIQIEYSSDGTNYTVFGTAAAKATYEYVRGPGEAAITQVRLTRTSGTSTQSTYAVNGQIQSSVSGDLTVATFAELLAVPSPVVGDTATVVAPVVGTEAIGGIPYTTWRYTESGWRLRVPQALLVARLAAVADASSSEQTLFIAGIAAALAQNLRLLQVTAVAGRSGTTNQVTLRGRIGGSNISAQPATSGTQRSVSFVSQLTYHADNELRAVWNGVAAAGGGGSGAVQPSGYEVPSLSTAQDLTVSTQVAGTTDVGALYYVQVDGV